MLKMLLCQNYFQIITPHALLVLCHSIKNVSISWKFIVSLRTTRHIGSFLISVFARIYFYCQLLLTIHPPFPICTHAPRAHELARWDYKFKQSQLIWMTTGQPTRHSFPLAHLSYNNLHGNFALRYVYVNIIHIPEPNMNLIRHLSRFL